MNNIINNVTENCIDCGLCVKECKFLQSYGNPKQICNSPEQNQIVFSCNLCGLCTEICPKNLDIPNAFLEIRKNHHQVNGAQKAHRPIRAYQTLNNSGLLSLFHIPEDCETVFFPGCSLTNTRTGIVEKLYNHLIKDDPRIGIILACCNKPNHDLGDNNFSNSFNELISKLKQSGIKKVITACSSCLVLFKTYETELEVESVYEVLALTPPITNKINEIVTIHDSCTTRNATNIHDSIRTLVKHIGGKVVESKYSRANTICCGEGGGATFITPEITSNWNKIRAKENLDKRLITYCTGCQNTINASKKSHILDLLFDKDAAKYQEKNNSSPLSFFHRFCLKHKIKKHSWGKISLFVLVITATIAARIFGLDQELKTEHLQNLITTLQQLPAIIYISGLSLAPVIFLPGFPFVMISGLLYGPYVGFIYAMLGSTIAAAISFLISRYVARSFIERSLGKILDVEKQTKLDNLISKNGWKMVIILRLLPIFPFTPLNYALGITGVSFRHYIVATIIGIAPACALFVIFSNSLWDLIDGGITKNFLIITAGLIAFFIITIVLKNIISKKFLTSP